MRRLFAIFLLSLVWACAAPTGDAPRIVLERAERDGWWRATYILDAPTTELRFQRRANFYREEVWEIVTPGWRLERRGEDQLLVASGATDRVVVEFPVYTEHLVKEYELFERFTDGSLALYTGHLYVTADPLPDAGAEDDAAYLRRVELVPRDGEHLVVRGDIARGRTVWDDPDDDGTYVYFGTIEPLETETMIGIVDPGAPGWLVDQLHDLLPQMFAMYTEGFGEPLPWKPVVLFSFEDIERGGLSSGGGTLSGLVQMSATGSAWHEATPDSSEHLLYLIAHEAAHLWNGQLHPYVDGDDSWMHEGSADAFAELALLRSGRIDAARLAQRRTTALNKCVLGLEDGALRDSADRGQFANYYTCGDVVAVWSVGVLGDPADFDRLFDVWRGVFAHSDPEDASYDRDSYFEALAALGVDGAALSDLQAVLDDALDHPATGLVDFLASAGIGAMVLDRPPPPVRRERAVAALEHLMGQACAGRYSFYREWPVLRTAPIDGCRPFAHELRISRIQGHEIDTSGDAALAATSDRCRNGRPVTLGLDDGETASVPCAEPPPTPPPPLGFPEL